MSAPFRMKKGNLELIRRLGQTFTSDRSPEPIKGLHEPTQGIIRFPEGVDIRPGDVLIGVKTQEAYLLLTVNTHAPGDVVVWVETRYETDHQKVRRMLAERARSSITISGTVQNSILNVTSQLENVTQSIVAHPSVDAALTPLLQQLNEALTKVTELADQFLKAAQVPPESRHAPTE